MDFTKKQNRKTLSDKFLFQAIGVIFLAAIIVLIFLDFKIYQKKNDLNSQVNDYQKQIEDIEKSSQNLKGKIANTNNTDYLEKIAYEQLGQQRPGEKEVIFIAPTKKAEITQSPENFWNKFLNWISWIKSKL